MTVTFGLMEGRGNDMRLEVLIGGEYIGEIYREPCMTEYGICAGLESLLDDADHAGQTRLADIKREVKRGLESLPQDVLDALC